MLTALKPVSIAELGMSAEQFDDVYTCLGLKIASIDPPEGDLERLTRPLDLRRVEKWERAAETFFKATYATKQGCRMEIAARDRRLARRAIDYVAAHSDEAASYAYSMDRATTRALGYSAWVRNNDLPRQAEAPRGYPDGYRVSPEEVEEVRLGAAQEEIVININALLSRVAEIRAIL